jgi:outer membrane immunogenic protein
MKKLLLGLAFAAVFALPASSALAADLPPPPPMDDLRPATYDWSGAYVGAFASAIAIDGHYDATALCGCGPNDPEMSGIGYGGGVLAGLNYQIDNFVLGIEGDWAFGGEVATNDDPAEATFLNFNNIATLRARAGWAHDNTLLYVTGGAAAVDTEFGGLVGPLAEDISESKWIYGWTAGAGIEHAFTDNLRGRLEYLYVGLPDEDYTLIASDGSGGTVSQMYNDIHMVRAGLTYNFNW